MGESSFILALAIISHILIFHHYEKLERANSYERYKLRKDKEELERHNKVLQKELDIYVKKHGPILKIMKLTPVDVNPEDLIEL